MAKFDEEMDAKCRSVCVSLYKSSLGGRSRRESGILFLSVRAFHIILKEIVCRPSPEGHVTLFLRVLFLGPTQWCQKRLTRISNRLSGRGKHPRLISPHFRPLPAPISLSDGILLILGKVVPGGAHPYTSINPLRWQRRLPGAVIPCHTNANSVFI